MTDTSKFKDYADLAPRIVVMGVGGAGGNAVNNMIAAGLQGVEFMVANTDAQALVASSTDGRIQLGVNLTEGLGAGSKPEIGEAAAEEAAEDIRARIAGAHMLFLAAGMGGGTGTGATSVIARIAKDMGILTVAVVTKPFQFEGSRRMRIGEAGIVELKDNVDTLIVIPNQNLFRIATDRTTFAEAFVLADQVLYSGIACIVDLIVKEGLINLDLADVKTVLTGMGTAMMGTGEASGDRRAVVAAEEAISNPLLDDVTLKGAKGLLVSIIGGHDLTLYEVDEAATRVRQEVDPEANIIVGATFDESLGDRVRVSIVASGMTRRGSLGGVSGRGAGQKGGDRDLAPPPLPPGQAASARGGQTEAEWRHKLAEALTPSTGSGARFEGTLASAKLGAGAVGTQAGHGGPDLGGDLADQIAAVRTMQASEVNESSYGVRPDTGFAASGSQPLRVPGIEAFPDPAQRAWQAAYGSDQGRHDGPPDRSQPKPHDGAVQKLSFLQRVTGAGRKRA